MNKNETKTAAAAEEQHKDAPAVETVETPDTTTQDEANVAGPEVADTSAQTDAPRDFDGGEAVTVIIVCTIDDDERPLQIAQESLARYLRGVDADVRVMKPDEGEALEQKLLDALDSIQTDRIVLMTDRMALLNPLSLAEIAVRKQDDCVVFMPAMMRKSVLIHFLGWKMEKLPDMPLAQAYAKSVDSDILPMLIGNWREDPWMLPVVTDNPSEQVLSEYSARKRFLCVKSARYPESVIAFMKKRLNG